MCDIDYNHALWTSTRDSQPDTPPPKQDAPSPDELWRLFAPAIAAAGRVRIARDNRHFRRAWERPLGARPAQPAAVRTYDQAGETGCVVFDLDCKRTTGRAAVERDSARLCGWLAEAGCSYLVDESPAGGRHVYVLLDHRRSQAEIAPLLKGIRASGALPTLDAGPMSGLTEGCIRPPGAAHRLGGHQRLITPLPAALAALNNRTTPGAWQALLTQLPIAETTRLDVDQLLTRVPSTRELTGTDPRPLAPYFAAIAATGQYDTTRYPSPSQARAAVILHAVSRGWTDTHIRARLNAGHWPGLLRLYTSKYGTAYASTALFGRHDQLKGDLGRAQDFITAHPLHRSLTSATRPRAGVGETLDTHLRKWVAAINLAIAEHRWEPTMSYGRELVLLALAEAARKSRSREVEHGTRHLSMHAGTVLTPTTVAAHLRALRSEDDPFILLLDSDRGAGADVYELVIPDTYVNRLPPATDLPPAPRGIHPVFSALPKPAYRLYTSLSTAGGPITAAELAQRASMPIRTVWAVLAELTKHNLAARAAGGTWKLGRRSLDRLARLLAIPARLRDLVIHWRQERDTWRITLGLPSRDLPWPRTVAWPGTRPPTRPAPLDQPPLTGEQLLAAATPQPPDWHTDDGLETETLQVLHDILGAELIHKPRGRSSATA
jgi:hypothetical protein